MKIPKSIRINGVEYPVDYVENLNDGARILKGQIEYAKHQIHINPTAETDEQDKCITFLHEAFHAICFEYTLNLEDEQEEKIVDAFSRGMFQILQDNADRILKLEEKHELPYGGVRD